jgi:hypothetical protein
MLFSGKIILASTTERRETILNLGWLRYTRIKKGAEKRSSMLGQAKLAPAFQIPSHASLHGIVKPHRSFCYANGPASRWNLWEKALGCAWPAKRGDVLKKHLQARLRGGFLQQIQHSRSESTP